MNPIYSSFLRNVNNNPEKSAFRFIKNGESTEYTWNQLALRIEQILPHLINLQKKQIVGILSSSQELQVIWYLAILARGAHPVILAPQTAKIDPEYYNKQIRAVIKRDQFSYVVTDNRECLLNDTVDIIYTYDRDFNLDEKTKDSKNSSVIDNTWLQYSSGTTAIRKGIVCSYESFYKMNHEYTSAIAIDGNSIICSWLPLYHDMGFITSFLMNIANCTFSCLIDPIDWINRPSILVQHASSVKATHIWMPNFAFQVMARIASRLEGLLDLSHVKYWTNCSEPITVTAMTEFLHAYRPHGIAVTNLAGCYGMAECVFAVTHKTYDEQSLITGAIDGRLSSGSPLGGTKVEIFKDANSDDFGMIRIHSPWMMEGYLNQTDANTFTKEWIQTNDIGMIVNKELYVIGRTNEWINVAGVKYDCRSIEDKLNSECDIYPGRVILTSIHHKNIGTNTPIVLCESKAGTNVNVLVQSIRNTLWSNYGLSVSKIIVKSKGFIVKTTSGKISRDETIRKLMIDLDVSGEITNREAAPIK